MPYSAPKLCSISGCKELGKHSHSVREYDRYRGGSTARGYGAKWQRLRMFHLRREPICRICKAGGRIVAATDVDHIIPKSRGGTDHWENLQSLCHACHSKKTAQEDGGFGNKD